MTNADRRIASSLLDEWHITHRPQLTAIRDAALALLASLDVQRDCTYRAELVSEIDGYAADLGGTTVDLLANLHGRLQRDADEAGVAPEMLAFETSVLEAAYNKWQSRHDARRMA
jgi:hypothetical protein